MTIGAKNIAKLTLNTIFLKSSSASTAIFVSKLNVHMLDGWYHLFCKGGITKINNFFLPIWKGIWIAAMYHQFQKGSATYLNTCSWYQSRTGAKII